MLHYLKEYAKYVEITGYRKMTFASAEAFLKANRKENQNNVDVQFFDAELIATQEHLYFAVLNALEAFKNKLYISKSLAMETMLFASAQRQIQKAIELCGIKPQTTCMAVVIIGVDTGQIEAVLDAITAAVGVAPDEKVLEITKGKEDRIRRVFEIIDEELKTVVHDGDPEKAVVDLVIERVALLATQL
jgi:tRNA threonylcarbamoyladenosine modification (KEOPS) complex Cgi121 subunit